MYSRSTAYQAHSRIRTFCWFWGLIVQVVTNSTGLWYHQQETVRIVKLDLYLFYTVVNTAQAADWLNIWGGSWNRLQVTWWVYGNIMIKPSYAANITEKISIKIPFFNFWIVTTEGGSPPHWSGWSTYPTKLCIYRSAINFSILSGIGFRATIGGRQGNIEGKKESVYMQHHPVMSRLTRSGQFRWIWYLPGEQSSSPLSTYSFLLFCCQC